MALESLIAQESPTKFAILAERALTHLRRTEAELSPPAPTAKRARRSIADRKVSLLKRSGFFGQDTKGAVIERACTFEDLRDAYRLVHDVYLGTGYILPEPAAIRLRIFETSSETATFVAKKDGRVVGVLSIVADSPDLGLPSDAAFGPELNALRASGTMLCEITNQAVAEEFRKTAVPTELMRCAIAHAVSAGYGQGIATVSPGHNGFYDLLGFKQLGGERSYSQKLHDPVVAMGLDIDYYRRSGEGLSEVDQFIHRLGAEDNHFVGRVGDWTKQARRSFLEADFLQQLFVNERNFMGECSPAQLRVLQRRWGQELFEAVISAMAPAQVAELRAKLSASREASAVSLIEARASAHPFETVSVVAHAVIADARQRVATSTEQILRPITNLLKWLRPNRVSESGIKHAAAEEEDNLALAS